jgi:hypothetical protein
VVRFCANCGTEVDDTAVFCPTCGQPIDQEVETEMPAAPAWPEPERQAAAVEPPDHEQATHQPAPAAPPTEEERGEPPPIEAEPPRRDGAAAAAAASAAVTHEDPTRVEARQPIPPGAGVPAAQPPPAAAGAPAAGPAINVPFTTPVTLSAWLIGVGAAVAALGALIGLFDGSGVVIDLLALIALVGVAASVFFGTVLPAIPHLRFITLAVVLVAFGASLDRLGIGRAGAGDLLLFLGAAAAAIGAVLLELGRDQPVGGPQS